MNKWPPFLEEASEGRTWGGGYRGGKRVCTNDDLRTSGFEKCGGLTTTEVRQHPMLLHRLIYIDI